MTGNDFQIMLYPQSENGKEFLVDIHFFEMNDLFTRLQNL